MPTVLLLDGGSYTSLPIARELTEDLDATVVGVGTSPHSRLLRSRYCDVRAIAPPTDHECYVEGIDLLVEHYRPDVLLPVGYDSTKRIEAARDRFSDVVTQAVPGSHAFRTAIDKRATRRFGERVGLEVPEEYTDLVAEYAERSSRPSVPPEVALPVFMKPRWEVDDGHVTTAIVDRPEEFWTTYDRITAEAPDNEVLVQEYVDGSESTFGCGAFVSILRGDCAATSWNTATGWSRAGGSIEDCSVKGPFSAGRCRRRCDARQRTTGAAGG